MNIKNKLMAAITVAVLIMPGISSAQSTSSAALLAQIQALYAQIQTLQSQLAVQGGSPATWCYSFNDNLSVGMSGQAVTALQTALQKDGESVTVSGTFDDQTASAVTGFQQKYASQILTPYSLSNGTGYAGKATRAELNSMFGCGTGTGTPTPITPPIIANPIIPTTTLPIACPGGGGVDASGNCGPLPIGGPVTSTPPIHACPAWGCNGPEPTPVPVSLATMLTISQSKISGMQASSVVPGEGGYDLLNVDLTAGASNVTVNMMNVSCGGFACSSGVTNLRLEEVAMNGTGISAQTWVGSSANPQVFTPNVAIPSGATVTMALYADVPLNAPVGQQMQWSLFPGSGLVTVTPTGTISGSAQGNLLNVVAAGVTTPPVSQPALSVSSSANSPAGGDIVMGSSQNTLGIFSFSANSNVENIKVTDLKIMDKTALGNGAAFSNVALWNGATELGVAGAPVTVTMPNDDNLTGYYYDFHFANPIVIPEGATVPLTLKGDAVSWLTGGIVDNGVHTFQIIHPSDVTALGATSNETAAVSANAYGGNWAVLRSTMAMSVAPLGGSSHNQSSLNPLGSDPIGAITIMANSAGSIEPGRITVTFSGNAVTSALLNSASLIAPSGVNVTNGGVATQSVNTGANTVTWIFNSGSSAPAWSVSARSSMIFTLIVNNTLIAELPSGAVPSLAASINNPVDVTYTDATDGKGTSGLTLPPTLFPMTINSVTYPGGSAAAPSSVDLKVNGSDGPISAAAKSNLNLTWTSSNVAGCYANNQGTWSGAVANSGSETVAALSPTLSTGYLYELTCSTPSGSTIEDGVQVNVSPAVVSASGTLSFSQTSFNFNYSQGAVQGIVPAAQSLTLTNTSQIPVTFTISVPNQPTWLNTGYATTPIPATPGTPVSIGASVAPANLAAGTYTADIILTGNFVGSPMAIPVTLTVTTVSGIIPTPIGKPIPSPVLPIKAQPMVSAEMIQSFQGILDQMATLLKSM